MLARTDLELQQKEVADRTGYSPSYLSKLEGARDTNVSVELVEALASVLCVSPAYLVGWTDDPLEKQHGGGDEDVLDVERDVLQRLEHIHPEMATAYAAFLMFSPDVQRRLARRFLGEMEWVKEVTQEGAR